MRTGSVRLPTPTCSPCPCHPSRLHKRHEDGVQKLVRSIRQLSSCTATCGPAAARPTGPARPAVQHRIDGSLQFFHLQLQEDALRPGGQAVVVWCRIAGQRVSLVQLRGGGAGGRAHGCGGKLGMRSWQRHVALGRPAQHTPIEAAQAVNRPPRLPAGPAARRSSAPPAG